MVLEDALLYYADHPVEFVEDVIGAKPDDIQASILRSVAANTMTSVRSGHGVGKSTVEAWTVIWFLATRQFPKIPCTAPTQHQLYDILWAEVSKWLRNNKALAREITWTKEKVYMKGYPEEWFAVARTASNPDALQGFHAEDVLYIIDEASGVKDEIFEPVLGALSTPGAKLLMCGNPTQLSGFFYDSHNRNRAQYSTFHIDGRESPRVSQDFVNTIIEMYGEDSDVFRVRVKGDFPQQEDDVFIPLPLIEQCIVTELPDVPIRRISMGVDVARFGDDETAIVTNVNGKVELPVIRHGQNLMSTVGDIVILFKKLVSEHQEYKGPITICVDDTGMGGGVTDRLEEVKTEQKLWRMEIVPVNFASKPPQDGSEEHYADITTYMWNTVKMAMKAGELALPDDSELVGQLSVRKYGITSQGRIQLESKEQMKKRKIKSPDRADALALSCFTPNRIYGQYSERAEAVIIPWDAVRSMPIAQVNIGISIGSSVRGTSFVATAIIVGHKKAVVLASDKYAGEVETDALGKRFYEFCHTILERFGKLDYAYVDAQEVFLYKCIRDAADRYSIPINVRRAADDDVNNRIRLTTRLLAQGRLFLTEDCETLSRALGSATWTERKTADTRSDSADVGTLNAFEYTIEREGTRFLSDR